MCAKIVEVTPSLAESVVQSMGDNFQATGVLRLWRPLVHYQSCWGMMSLDGFRSEPLDSLDLNMMWRKWMNMDTLMMYLYSVPIEFVAGN